LEETKGNEAIHTHQAVNKKSRKKKLKGKEKEPSK
jgi:hypothetical protein